METTLKVWPELHSLGKYYFIFRVPSKFTTTIHSCTHLKKTNLYFGHKASLRQLIWVSLWYTLGTQKVNNQHS